MEEIDVTEFAVSEFTVTRIKEVERAEVEEVEEADGAEVEDVVGGEGARFPATGSAATKADEVKITRAEGVEVAVIAVGDVVGATRSVTI